MKRFISQRCQLSHLLPRLSAVMAVLLSLAGMTTSCSSADEMFDNTTSKNTPHEVILKATAGEDSRVDYTEDAANKKLVVTWSKNPTTSPDQLIVYYKVGDNWSYTTFTQTTQTTSDSHTAYFKGDITGTPTEYVAVVQKSGSKITAESDRFFFDLSANDGTLADAGDNDILIAKATVASGSTEAPVLQFKHRSSILKLVINLPSTETATTAEQISFFTKSGLGTKYYYYLTDIEKFEENSFFISSAKISNQTLTLYLPIVTNSTGQLTGTKLTFYAGLNYYVVDLGDKTVAPGKLYKATRTVNTPAATVASQYNGGDGTENNPWQINNAAQMRRFNMTHANGYYKLTADIDLENILWTPVNLSNSNFDGNGKVISNLTVSGYNDMGLFGYLDKSAIRNLTAQDATVIGNATSNGIIAGSVNNGSTIVNCKSSGTVSGIEISATGGIVGVVDKYSSVIACSSSATVSGGAAGGIAGESNGTITGCYSTGKVTGTQNGISGGITGYLDTGYFTSCYSTADVSVGNEGYCGGIVGFVALLGHVSSACYTTLAQDAGGSGTTKGVTDMNTTTIVDAMNAAIKTWNSGTYNSASVAGTIHECKYQYKLGTGTGATPVLVAGAPQ